MTTKDKTHYRKVFKSDHLGSADLEDMIESGTRLVFTISHVNQEYGTKVAGKKIDANIAYFKESIKPLVLNATNSKMIKKLSGSSFVEDWAGLVIELYIDPNVKMKGETTQGVRVSPNSPQPEKPELTPENAAKWNQAIAAFQRDGNLNAVLKRCVISSQNQNLIREQASV